MPSHWAQKYIKDVNGPFAIGRVCKICGFGITTKKLPKGRAGRGRGMREGNKLRGQMIQHIKEEHPEYKPTDTTISEE